MASIDMHPSEFAYAFSFAQAQDVIGWGIEAFQPPADTDEAAWLTEGEERLRAAGRLIGSPDEGLNFADDTTSDIMALVNPSVVLMAERKAGDQVKRLTVHGAGSDFIGLSRRPDGLFDLTRYSELTAAAGACAGFLGASFDRLESEARIETDLKTLKTVHKFSDEGEGRADKALTLLGLSEQDATSAVKALSQPSAAGVLSTLYCAGNIVQDADPITVMTNADNETWILFQPGSVDGPMILERSSVGALTARVSVGAAARLTPPEA